MPKDNKYDSMPHRFNAMGMLAKLLALKGAYYPGAHIPWLTTPTRVSDKPDYILDESLEIFNIEPEYYPTEDELKTIAYRSRLITDRASIIREENGIKQMCFMPVWIKSSIEELEIPAAIISIKGKKTIVSTPLIGRRGSVKELISVDDYEITIKGVLMSYDEHFPEEQVQQFRELFELNESVELISAISDLVLQLDNRIVIKSIDFPPTDGVENAQMIHITAETDSQIELIID